MCLYTLKIIAGYVLRGSLTKGSSYLGILGIIQFHHKPTENLRAKFTDCNLNLTTELSLMIIFYNHE